MEAEFKSFASTPARSKEEEAQKPKQEKQFLQFYLEPDTKVMLPIAELTEVITIPLGQIIPIPHMKEEVMGVYNWRGEILWMIDLGKMVGLLPWYEQTRNTANYKAIVVSIKVKEKEGSAKNVKAKLGLVVSRVEDIKWCEEKSIRQPTSSSQEKSSLLKFVRGYWLKSDGEKIAVLNGEAILKVLPTRAVDIN